MADVILKVPDVMNRVHAINQTIPGLAAYRTWRQDIHSGIMPAAIPLPGPASHESNTYGVNAVRSLRQIYILLMVGKMMDGIPSESAQLLAEQWLFPMLETYWARPLLQLVVGGPVLDGLLEPVTLSADSGIIRSGDDNAAIRFTLTVPMVEDIETE